MMKDSLNKKTYIGDIEPNPKEFGIWVKQDGTAKVYDYVKNEWKGGSSNDVPDQVLWHNMLEYFDLSQVPELFRNKLKEMAVLFKWRHTNDYLEVGPIWFDRMAFDYNGANNVYNSIEAVAVFTGALCGTPYTGLTSVLTNPELKEAFETLPRITVTEFYNFGEKPID